MYSNGDTKGFPGDLNFIVQFDLTRRIDGRALLQAVYVAQGSRGIARNICWIGCQRLLRMPQGHAAFTWQVDAPEMDAFLRSGNDNKFQFEVLKPS